MNIEKLICYVIAATMPPPVCTILKVIIHD